MSLSILNDVLGPVMRGPSSSHTAGSYHIARIVTTLFGGHPASVGFTFDPAGSYAQVYRQQGVDLAFAAGVMGWDLTDDRFFRALEVAAAEGLDLTFDVQPLEKADHPNTVEIRLAAADGTTMVARARSVGGGAVEVTQVDSWPVLLRGDTWDLLVEVRAGAADKVAAVLGAGGHVAGDIERTAVHGRGATCCAPDVLLLIARRSDRLDTATRAALLAVPGVVRVREASPVAFVKRGRPLFETAGEMVALAEARGVSLGAIALQYEAQVLGVPERRILDETIRRFEIMRAAVHAGLSDQQGSLRLLAPSAGQIFRADAEGRLPLGGIHTRAAARAMAVMHVNGTSGVVCAAPTGGSAGALPGVVVTLAEERGVDTERIARALLAASAIGLILGTRATFAAEVAGCQVEIGAAGAMAAAAVVEAAGGSARDAADAAAIAFQNTMGSVCDLVQGIVEIPCHTRNAVAASSAFVCADLVVGGYRNPIPLDETIDAVFAVGKMMPSELRVTARGGLAVTPSALKLTRRS
jgi:L-serine dehydratase